MERTSSLRHDVVGWQWKWQWMPPTNRREARDGAAVLPVLDNLNRVLAKQQILQMAAGRLDSAGRELIEAREASISRDYPLYSANIVSQLESAIAGGMSRATTFEEACARFDPHLPGIIRQIIGGRISAQDARRLHERLGEFPALRTTVRANLYIWAVPMMSGGPGVSSDKNDDYRHIIEPSYCSVFVTGDHQLANTAPRIHPGLSVLTWQSLEAG